MSVLDASAVLAFLQGELGADVVEAELAGAVIGAASWSEIAQKVHSRGADWTIAASVLESYGIRIEPVTRADAEAAALLWSADSGLSLGERLCLALGQRLGEQVLTADHAWGTGERVRQIR